MTKVFLIFALVFALMSCGRKINLQSQLEDYIASCNAEIGVAVIIDHHDTIVVNEGNYPMNSVMKLYQGIPSALKMTQAGITIMDSLTIQRSELQNDTWSPMLKDHEDSIIVISYDDLLKYAIAQSDNNASDILFALTADIQEVNRYWQAKGIKDFQIKWNEAQIHEDTSRNVDNRTTPLAAAKAINRMIPYAIASSDKNVATVAGILMKCQTGLSRIPKPLENIAFIAHKTGTGFPDDKGYPTGVNDVAFIMLPDGRCYSLAIFVKNTKVNMEATEAMIARISRIVFDFVVKPNSNDD